VSANVVQSLVAFVSGGIVPVQVTVTVWPPVEGTVMLSVPGEDAATVRTKEERVNVVMIAAIVTQASATRMIFIRKLTEARLLSESFDMMHLLLRRYCLWQDASNVGANSNANSNANRDLANQIVRA
jgi:hypothetical protein